MFLIRYLNEIILNLFNNQHRTRSKKRLQHGTLPYEIAYLFHIELYYNKHDLAWH